MPTRDEWHLINHLLLADYFRQCHHGRALELANELGDAGTGLLTIRGTLQNTITTVTASGVNRDDIPISSFSGGFTAKNSHLSDLLQIVAAESGQTHGGNGVMRRIVGGHHRTQQPVAVATGKVAMSALQAARELAYIRYERSILAYMAVAAVEQLLRALASHQGGDGLHIKAGEVPKGVPRWIGALGLPPGLVDRILILFDSAKGNIRNRIMHGVFVFTSTKRLRDNLSVIAPPPASAAGGTADRYTPANIVHLALECVRDLDTHLVGVPLTNADFSWAAVMRLSHDDIAFCRSLAGKLLPNADQSNLNEADNRRRELSEYFRAVMPGLGQFFRLGYVGVIQLHSPNTVALLHALGLVFEPIFRLTCHLVGLEVVQKPDAPSPALHFQYWMLDDDGLCRGEHLERLVQHRDPSSREEGRRILGLAVRARNAMAHGAIIHFDEATCDGLKRLFAEAIQLLVDAGRHHMIREGAWLNWKEAHKFEDGHQLDDWLTAETAVWDRIRELGRTPQV